MSRPGQQPSAALAATAADPDDAAVRRGAARTRDFCVLPASRVSSRQTITARPHTSNIILILLHRLAVRSSACRRAAASPIKPNGAAAVPLPTTGARCRKSPPSFVLRIRLHTDVSVGLLHVALCAVTRSTVRPPPRRSPRPAEWRWRRASRRRLALLRALLRALRRRGEAGFGARTALGAPPVAAGPPRGSRRYGVFAVGSLLCMQCVAYPCRARGGTDSVGLGWPGWSILE